MQRILFAEMLSDRDPIVFGLHKLFLLLILGVLVDRGKHDIPFQHCA